MNKKFTILSCLCVFTAMFGRIAKAGNEKGNGGDAVVCRDINNEIKSIDILDFFEARLLYNLTISSEDHEPTEDIVQSVLKRVGQFDAKRASRYSIDASQFTANANFIPGVSLVDIPDSQGEILPTGCQIEQLVIRTETAFPEQKLYTVSKDLWDRLNRVQQAGIILHEVIYGETSRLGQLNSIKARYLNGWIFSDRFKKINFSDYKQLIDRVGLPYEPVSTQIHSCQGIRLPGDYASLWDAVRAVNGTTATICLGEGSVKVGAPNGIMSLDSNTNLEIVGMGRGKSIIEGSPYFSCSLDGHCDIRLEGVTVTRKLYVGSHTDIVLQGIDVPQLDITFYNRHGVKPKLFISSIQSGLVAIGFTSGQITVENSVIDPSIFSLRGSMGVNLGAVTSSLATVIIQNNIFMNIQQPGGAAIFANSTAQIANNVFYNNSCAVSGRGSVSTHNAFFQNKINFSNGAVAGDMSITNDPMLDFTFSPPTPNQGSPLIQAGDPRYVPSNDFFGRPRGSFADVGPVQSQY